MRPRLRFFFLLLAGLSWVVLLLSALGRTGVLALLTGPEWVTQLAQALFTLSVFAYVRQAPDPLRGQRFVPLLRGLVLGPGLLALAGLALHLLARAGREWLGPASFPVVYTLNLGLFVLYVAQVKYAWRSLVFFRSGAGLRRQWTWFEVGLSLALLSLLLNWRLPAPASYLLWAGLGLLGVYLSANQKWVAYLTLRQRWLVVLCEGAILGGLLLFVAYFRYADNEPALRVLPAQHEFLLLTAFFAAFYAGAGLLVAFFNLPTALVFEQRQAEVLGLQRLLQVMQRGQSAAEVYRVLLASLVETLAPDAAWLDAAPSPNGTLSPPPPAECRVNLSDAQTLALRSGARLPDFRSRLTQPLRAAEHDYGTLYVLKTEPNAFEADDQRVLQAFASQAVLSLENLLLANETSRIQRVQDELRIAAQVQENLIPKQLPTDDWFELATYAQAAREVGGDFYDLLLLPGRRLAVLIGDVSGKGVAAAFHMAQMKAIFHALMQPNPLAKSERSRYPAPSQFMVQANAALAHCLERSSFITASLFLIDYENGGFMFARAGHCHALYYSSNQEKVEFFQSPGLGLGIMRGAGYEKHVTNQFYDYAPGDVMVMYTDGIVEARDGQGTEYTEERLRRKLEECYYRTAHEIKNFLVADLEAFTAGQPMHDDQTLLVIKFKVAKPSSQP